MSTNVLLSGKLGMVVARKDNQTLRNRRGP